MKSLLNLYHYTKNSLIQFSISELVKTNQISRTYGLALTDQQAAELVQVRNRAVQSHGRVELSIDVVKKIIAAFCSSNYIHQDEYAQILGELIEIFYYMKNETEDLLGDEELIAIMKEYFETSCQGSLELLVNRELYLFARKLRSEIKNGFSSQEEQV